MAASSYAKMMGVVFGLAFLLSPAAAFLSFTRCVDVAPASQCQRHVELGHCSLLQMTMSDLCAKSCKFCILIETTPDPAACVDIFKSSCFVHALSGLCDHDTMALNMHKNCKRTCGYCNSPPPVKLTTKATPTMKASTTLKTSSTSKPLPSSTLKLLLTTKGTAILKASTTSKPAPASTFAPVVTCSNVFRESTCNSYVEQGYCTHVDHIDFMNRNCRAACKFCIPTPRRCYDEYPTAVCQLYADLSFCIHPQHALTARTKCRLSCGVCKPVVVPTTPKVSTESVVSTKPFRATTMPSTSKLLTTTPKSTIQTKIVPTTTVPPTTTTTPSTTTAPTTPTTTPTTTTQTTTPPSTTTPTTTAPTTTIPTTTTTPTTTTPTTTTAPTTTTPTTTTPTTTTPTTTTPTTTIPTTTTPTTPTSTTPTTTTPTTTTPTTTTPTTTTPPTSPSTTTRATTNTPATTVPTTPTPTTTTPTTTTLPTTKSKSTEKIVPTDVPTTPPTTATTATTTTKKPCLDANVTKCQEFAAAGLCDQEIFRQMMLINCPSTCGLCAEFEPVCPDVFTCSAQCTPEKLKCDGVVDCDDASDEMSCVLLKEPTCVKPTKIENGFSATTRLPNGDLVVMYFCSSGTLVGENTSVCNIETGLWSAEEPTCLLS